MAVNYAITSCGDRRLLRAMRYVLRDLTRQPQMKELASIAGLERTYFCRRFHQAIGVTYCKWSRDLRLERARELLAKTDLPISAVAAEVGYGDVTTFARNFRKCCSASPGRYTRTQLQTTENTIFADNSTKNAEKSGRTGE